MSKIAVVTDTNSGITREEAKKLGVYLLPMPFIVDGTEYFEGVTCTYEHFFEMLEAGAEVSTSQPSPESLTAMWEEALATHDSVVHIPMSSALSGSCDTAKALAAEYNGRVCVVDNKRISITQRESVLDALTLAEKGLPATRQQITDNLFAALQRLDYVPATVTMPGDPAGEPGDRVALPMEDGTAPEMLVTHFVWRYRGRQTLKGVGRNPYLGGTTDGATEKALRRLQNSAESKRIVYYSFTNPAELAVQTVETPAVAIAFTAVEETSAMFLAQLLLDAAPDTGKVLTLTVRYYINDVPVENFAPQQRLETGAHTLALFYPFASVEAGTVTRLSVRLVCAGGTVKIAPYGIKATVTGQGMASETPWDGTLECEETLLPIAIKARSINV